MCGFPRRISTQKRLRAVRRLTQYCSRYAGFELRVSVGLKQQNINRALQTVASPYVAQRPLNTPSIARTMRAVVTALALLQTAAFQTPRLRRPPASTQLRRPPTKLRGAPIGPAEVENSLLTHPAVQMSAVIGLPDEARGEMVKAYVILKDGQTPSDALAGEIQNHVKTRLAAHEYPRAVEFVDALPMTTTGKIQRMVLREQEAAKES